MKLGIVGIGTVGRVLLKYFQERQREVVVYDSKGLGSFEDVVRADQIYICVPTPSRENGSCDTSIVEEIVQQIDERKDAHKVVIIKSTVIPGTTERLQAQYSGLALMYNPEFLTRATAVRDMFYPDRQIIGYTSTSFEKVFEVQQQLPSAPFERVISATEAELVKYFTNTFYATKVIFANQMYDLCGRLSIDYEHIKECIVIDKFIGTNHWDIFHGGYRGYGGGCLPKDSKALIKLGEELGVNLEVLKVVDKVNEDLLQNARCNNKTT